MVVEALGAMIISKPEKRLQQIPRISEISAKNVLLETVKTLRRTLFLLGLVVEDDPYHPQYSERNFL